MQNLLGKLKLAVVFFCLFLGFFVSSATFAADYNPLDGLRLTEKSDSYDLAPYIRVIEAKDDSKGIFEAIGEYAEGKSATLSNYKFLHSKAKGYWLIFRIRNADDAHKDWVIDFGRNSDGTMGVSNIFMAYTSDNFAHPISVDGRLINNKVHLHNQKKNSIPTTIDYTEIKTYAFYIEPVDGLPLNLAPRIVLPSVNDNAVYSYDSRTTLFNIFMLFLVFIAFVVYMTWRDGTGIVLGAYTVLSLIIYCTLDEVIPYGNNTGAVYIDVLCIVNMGLALILTHLTMRKLDDDGFSSRTYLAGLFMLGFALVGNINPDVSKNLSDITFLVLAVLVPVFILAKTAIEFVKGGKSIGGIFYAAAWVIVLYDAVMREFLPHSIGDSGFNYYFFGFMLHITALYLGVIFTLKAKYRAINKKRDQIMLQTNAENEIKRNYEIVSKNRLVEAVQRERDLLLDLKRHDTETVREERVAKDSEIRFLSMLSHEIRTPMTGMLGLINMLLGTKLSEKQKEYVDALHRTSNALLMMLNDILDLSRAESGKLQLDEVKFDMTEIINHVTNIMKPFANEKGLDFQINIDSKLPKMLKGDPVRIRQVLSNLLSNAIKFTEHGFVRVDVKYLGEENDNQQIKFSVQDTGCGIDEDKQKNLFAPYVQEGKTTYKRYGATGLGLAICYQLVKSMGGELGLISAEDKGSTFFFTISLKLYEESEEGQEAAAKANDKNVDNIFRIMTIDNDDIFRKMLTLQATASARNKKCEIMSFKNSIDIMNAMDKYYFDIIFMDYEMPDFSVVNTTTMIRKLSDKKKARTPVITMTSTKDQAELQSIIQAGVNSYIAKPVNAKNLGDVISSIANKSEILSGALGSSLGEIRNERVPERTDGVEDRIHNRAENDGSFSFDVVEDVVNLKKFEHIKKAMSVEAFNKAVAEMHETLAKEFADLEKAANKRSMNDIMVHCHVIKTIAENFGFDAMDSLSLRIGRRARNNEEMEVIVKYIKQLVDIYEETKDEFQKIIDGK